MATRALVCFCMLVGLVSALDSGNFIWTDDPASDQFNCKGKVTDAICCPKDFCSASTKELCVSGSRAAFCTWSATSNSCEAFRDSVNNVCCQGSVKEECDKIAKGLCPVNYQVPNECCSSRLAGKYNATLAGVSPGFVCCNAPCTEVQKAREKNPALKCPYPPQCISGRSLDNPLYDLGFYNLQAAQSQYLQKKKYGSISNGFQGDYAFPLLDALGPDQSKDSQVPEITVDDLMNTLIDALSDDTNVMMSNAEITSDPFFGKTKSGGPLTKLNLPNPNFFLKRIYGSPFGLSQGQLGSFPSLPSLYNVASYPGFIQGGFSLPGYGSLPAAPSYGSYAFGGAPGPQFGPGPVLPPFGPPPGYPAQNAAQAYPPYGPASAFAPGPFGGISQPSGPSGFAPAPPPFTGPQTGWPQPQPQPQPQPPLGLMTWQQQPMGPVPNANLMFMPN